MSNSASKETTRRTHFYAIGFELDGDFVFVRRRVENLWNSIHFIGVSYF